MTAHTVVCTKCRRVTTLIILIVNDFVAHLLTMQNILLEYVNRVPNSKFTTVTTTARKLTR